MKHNDPSQNYYLYLSGMLNPVIESQVMNWLKVLQKKGIVFDLLISNPILLYWWKRKQQVNRLPLYRSNLQGRIYQILVYEMRIIGCFNYISSSIKAIFILLLIRSKTKKNRYKNLIIQTRSSLDYLSLKIVKKMNPNVKIIMDLRGEDSMEYLNAFGYDTIDEVTNNKITNRYYSIVDRTDHILHIAESVICVSKAMEKHILAKYKNVSKSKIFVIPGGADREEFFFNEEVRTATREMLCIDKSFVFIYSGGLKKYWQKKRTIFEFMSRIQEINANTIFLCLTSDMEIATELKKKYFSSNANIFILAVNSNEVNNYLCAADAGIILRDDIHTNRVSSPTKVAEYLLAGLPVIISKNVGDYSEFIDNNGYGVVVNNNIDIMINEIELGKLKNINRHKVGEYSASIYSKQIIMNKLMQLYSQLG